MAWADDPRLLLFVNIDAIFPFRWYISQILIFLYMSCMEKERILSVGNYRRLWPQAWEKHVGFIERGEKGFPVMEGCDDVDVLSLFGEPFECDTALMCASISDDRLEDEAYRFGLELALNGWPVSSGGRSGGIEKAFRAGFLDGDGRLECFLSDGIMSVFSNRRLRRLSSIVLANDGAVYSCYEPDVSDREGRGRRMLFKEYLATRKRRIVVLGLSKSGKDIVEQALMSGSEVYVHTSFMSSQCARMLAEDGAQLVDSAAHFILLQGGRVTSRVYPDGRGQHFYEGKGYGVFSS